MARASFETFYKVWTLGFVSLVVFKTGENHSLRSKVFLSLDTLSLLTLKLTDLRLKGGKILVHIVLTLGCDHISRGWGLGTIACIGNSVKIKIMSSRGQKYLWVCLSICLYVTALFPFSLNTLSVVSLSTFSALSQFSFSTLTAL